MTDLMAEKEAAENEEEKKMIAFRINPILLRELDAARNNRKSRLYRRDRTSVIEQAIEELLAQNGGRVPA